MYDHLREARGWARRSDAIPKSYLHQPMTWICGLEVPDSRYVPILPIAVKFRWRAAPTCTYHECVLRAPALNSRSDNTSFYRGIHTLRSPPLPKVSKDQLRGNIYGYFGNVWWIPYTPCGIPKQRGDCVFDENCFTWPGEPRLKVVWPVAVLDSYVQKRCPTVIFQRERRINSLS